MNHEADYLPAEIYNSHNQTSENRQGPSQLLDTRICDIRPVLPERLARFGYVGGQALKVRRPDIGEVGLSKSEIEHAVQYGITMDGKNENN
jgi:hypothetical protein